MNMKHDNCKRDMGILLISLLAEEGVSTLTMVLTLILTCLTTSWGGRFFYLTRPLLLGEVPHLPRFPLLRRGLQPVNRLFCTRKQALAPAGLLVSAYATELRLFVRRGRGCAKGRLMMIDDNNL